MDFLRTLQQTCTPAGLRLDIGANEGGYTYLMRQHHPGVIWAFEPIPVLYQQVATRFADDPDIVVFPYAISDQSRDHVEGYSVFEAWTIAPTTYTVRGRNAHCRDHLGVTEFAVTFRRVDDLVPPTAHVDFLKIDTDGYEAHVLRGARQTIRRCRPPILIELGYLIGDLGESIPDLLTDIYDVLGYHLITQAGDRWTTRQQAINGYPYTTTCDVAMVPQEWMHPLLG